MLECFSDLLRACPVPASPGLFGAVSRLSSPHDSWIRRLTCSRSSGRKWDKTKSAKTSRRSAVLYGTSRHLTSEILSKRWINYDEVPQHRGTSNYLQKGCVCVCVGLQSMISPKALLLCNLNIRVSHFSSTSPVNKKKTKHWYINLLKEHAVTLVRG